MKNTLILEANIGKKQMVNVLVMTGMRAKYRFCDIYIETINENEHKVFCEIDFIEMEYIRECEFVTKATDRFLKYLSKYEGVSYVQAKVKRN